jgi:hypothetical protein
MEVCGGPGVYFSGRPAERPGRALNEQEEKVEKSRYQRLPPSTG